MMPLVSHSMGVVEAGKVRSDAYRNQHLLWNLAAANAATMGGGCGLVVNVHRLVT